MNRFLFSAFLLSAGLSSVMAERIMPEEAREIAEDFLSNRINTRSRLDFTNLSVEQYKDAIYIINNPDGGWVLVAADNGLSQQVLGYSDQGCFELDNLSDGARWMLDEYAQGINSLRVRQREVSSPTRTGKSVLPLLGEISWDQYEPYNDLCPVIDGIKSVAGCTNIAVGQIMRYHKHPQRGNGSYSYTLQDVEYSADFSKSEYKWDLMKPQYNGEETQAERDAVAGFIYDLAICNHSYFGSATGAGFILDRFTKCFGYDKSLRCVERNLCSRADYERLMREEIDAGRPLFVQGGSSGGAHAFVCDGYDGDGYFHYNFGWGPYNNGYLLSTATGFDANPSLVISIKPDQGGLPGLWAGSGDDFKWTHGDDISCSIEGKISMGVNADMEVSLAVENKQTNEIRYIQKQTFENQPDFYVGVFNFSDVIPDGTYNLYPVYRVAGDSKWDKVCFADNCSNHVEVEVKNGVKTYTNVGIGGVADEGVFERDGVFYRVENGEAMVTSRNNRGNCYEGDVIIPAEIEYEGSMIPVTVIGENAFKNSMNIKNMIIGKNVRELAFASFCDCEINNLQFAKDSGLKTIGGWAFNACIVPELRLPKGLENLGLCAFRGDINLLDLPETLTDLPSETISCTGLKDVYVHWKDEASLPTYYEWTISCSVGNATLHVPAGCADLYRNHPLWSAFGKFKEDAEDAGVNDLVVNTQDLKITTDNGRLTVESSDSGLAFNVYSSQGGKVATLIPGQSIYLGSGVYIVRTGNKSYKVMVVK
ncbi:MAG: C10 family peptidase [Muribaculaceae bacterium]|nr:C10 family peptidase [Muribaculaceae bacterium]